MRSLFPISKTLLNKPFNTINNKKDNNTTDDVENQPGVFCSV